MVTFLPTFSKLSQVQDQIGENIVYIHYKSAYIGHHLIYDHETIDILNIFRQWSGRPVFNPWSLHTKDFKNGT